MADDLILVVDDEQNIIQLTRMYLTREGYQVEAAMDGRAALEAVDRLQPSLMVLDLMLPEINGLEVCRRLRAVDNPIPILMLTARDDDIDKILGLEFGADDYLTKPFNPRELVARIKAILRRGGQSALQPAAPLRVGNLVIDPARREVTIKGEQIHLRTKEFDLLLTLIQHKSLVLSRDQLLDLAWGYEYYGQTRTVDVHIAHLRKKIASGSIQIETVTGVGYKLIAPA